MPANYFVEVTFIKSRNRTHYIVGDKFSRYPFCHGNVDTFTFIRKGFSLLARRSGVYADGTILNNDRNGLYQQIIKGLLVYYALSDDFPILKSITIKRIKSRTADYVYKETSTFQQPLRPGVPKKYYMPISFADEILQETERAQALRIALTYWLKAMNSSDLHFKFDRFWRAYDRLLLYEGNTTRESVGIPCIKNVISDNSALFPISIGITNTYSAIELRSFQWNALFANKTIGYTKINELVRRLTEYSDYRIVSLFRGISNGKKIHHALSNSGNLPIVNNHFAVNAATINDIDLVLLLSLTYTYYIRCRLFHGEVIDSTFKLKITREDYEVEKLVLLLESVIYELLSNWRILR